MNIPIYLISFTHEMTVYQLIATQVDTRHYFWVLFVNYMIYVC